MRRALLVSACLVLAGLFVLYLLQLYSHRQHSSAESGKKQGGMRIYDATSNFCAEEVSGPQSRRLIVVHLTGSTASVSAIPTLKVNRTTMELRDAQSQLTDIFYTRENKVAFLEGDPQVTNAETVRVIDILGKAGVQELCVVDPAHPPKWHFPPPEPA